MKPNLLLREVAPFFGRLAALLIATLLMDAGLHLLDAVWIGRYLGIPGVLLILASFGHSLRKATREAVAHIPAKLASAGIDPALWRGVAGPPRLPPDVALFEDAEELEALAGLEHERWNAQRRLDGWRWTYLPAKDEVRRLHPSLVPFEALSESAKSYDRAIVGETQAICWATPRVIVEPVAEAVEAVDPATSRAA